MKDISLEYREIKKGILLVDKPAGISSFDVIRRLRRELGIRKMGHAGTLDPLASGLMIIALEDKTKELDAYLKLPKTYIAEILLGQKTTTGDLEGEILESVELSKSNFDRRSSTSIVSKIRQVLEGMLGKHLLPVPFYSAIKVDGKALYKYARSDKQPPRIPEKEMEVLAIKLLEYETKSHILTVELQVSSGTYIRTLAEEIGRRLGYPATLALLRRTKIGEYALEQIIEGKP